ncbi:uncharacterized protein A4U43_C03F23980 [Asparagus officinalis]|uniref:non-specific serine/threonine protein kinase n=1 Tax=Asparagus officinalis TaxID=4686 RepID=A0A5P1FFD1_ASPOF|nr:uncharacterized protein A4U43_C03F23980 [Asparagus officinalis]
MQSPRFRAILRATSGRRKRPTADVKSFSHELNIKDHRLPIQKLRGLSSPDDVMRVIRSKFSRLKQEVNSELGVYAGDLVSVLEKTTKNHPEWREQLEDLLVVAQKCAEMTADEFWVKCESIVQNLDDRRQELQMGTVKQAHTRILFILTRCTRLLQFQKESGYVENEHVLGRHQFSDLGFYPEQVISGDGGGKTFRNTPSAKAIKNKLIMKKLQEHGLTSAYLTQDFAGRPLSHSNDTDSPGSRDRLSSWKKLPSAAEKNQKKSDPVDEHDSPVKKVLDTLPHLDRRKVRLDEPKDNLEEEEKHIEAQHVHIDDGGGKQGITDETPKMICRICEFEIPTLHAESHFKICTVADKCDAKGLTVDERLEKVSEILENILEPTVTRTLDVAVMNHDATKANVACNGSELVDLTPNTAHASPRESMESSPEAISSCTTIGHRGLPSTLCNKSFVPKLDLASLAPSSGSMTPRSPLPTPGVRQIDLLLTVKSAFSELENFQQIKNLLDIVHCIAGIKTSEYSSLESLSSYLEELNGVISNRKVDALIIETFGRRIEKLLQEKFIQLCGQIDDGNKDSPCVEVDDDGSADDRSHSSQHLCTKLKDRTSIEDFEIIKPISRGAFGRVFLAKKRITGDFFAIKVLKKSDMIRKNAVESILAERNILISVRNPFVNLYLVMEYLNGGDLYSLLRNLGCLDEEMARTYVAELVLALEYLHSLSVIHRDLKPDNLLIGRDGHIKLTDFGLSKVGLINSTDDLSGPDVSSVVLQSEHKPIPASVRAEIREQRRKQSAVGTPDYLAPEILLGMSHGQTADWWSVGVILFELLVGIPPFNAEHPQKIFDNIMNRDIPWPHVPEEISHDAYDLVDK